MTTKGLQKRTERYKELQANLPSTYRHRLHMHEYMLVLKPHEELRNHIRQVKDAFAEKYDAPMARFLEPHITLVRFLCWDMVEAKIVQRLQHIAISTAAFSIELKDFGSFPSHTIYPGCKQSGYRKPCERIEEYTGFNESRSYP
ncbi:MAG TPA: 2'-5' RNA ligase family protein [Phnomibacter sp.]|nr:2'-5' RNA ligase family protein [Phnomibacter sp.]